MHSLVCISAIFSAYVNFVSGQTCLTPDGGVGQCQSILICKPLADLLYKKSRTPEEVELLRKSQCGYEGKTPKVCCPSEASRNICYDPKGNKGICVHLSKCKQVDLLEHAKNSSCVGETENSVCCRPEAIDETKKRSFQCSDLVSAYPPDPASNCCGTHVAEYNKILGGNQTFIDQYPWLALIDYIKDGVTKQLCGGVLISGRYVLTAAHCVVGNVMRIGTPRIVRLGEYDKSIDGPDCEVIGPEETDCTEGEIKIPIEQIIPHPEYDQSTQYHDIALIKLAKMAPYTDFIRPICLPSADETKNSPESIDLSTAGWGTTELQSYSHVKLHMFLPFVKLEQCQTAYTQLGLKPTLWDKQLCAGGQNGEKSCMGDSGGPLMFRNGRTYEVIGVDSFRPKRCSTGNTPNVYTKVIEYKEWIISNMKP